jgi:AAA+ ATPase superfamily predicted ATPase
MAIRNLVGASAEGSDFYGRKREIARALVKLKNGNSLLLSAPRRVGKTSFAKKMIEELEKEGWTGYFMNLESITDESGFINKFIDLLYSKGDGWSKGFHSFMEWAKGIKIDYGNVSLNSSRKINVDDFRREVKKLIDDPENGHVIFVFDEVAVFLRRLEEQGKTNVESFLSWMRSLRQECRGKNCWIFCSSNNIENYLSANDLNASMNDVLEFELAEIPKDEAIGLIRELAEGADIVISDDLCAYIIKRIGQTIPYYIQVLFSAIVDQDPDEGVVKKSHIDQAYEELIKTSSLNTWHERIKYYGVDADDLKKILTVLCKSPDGKTADELMSIIPSMAYDNERFIRLLKILAHDGYLIKNTHNRFAFRSNILRDYWKDRFII